MKATDKQVGGDHYKKLAIQPMQYSIANNLDALQHTAIKYITRHKFKGGRADIEKAIHCLEMVLEMQYPPEGLADKATKVEDALFRSLVNNLTPRSRIK